MTIDIAGSPYYLADMEGSSEFRKAISDLTERVELLRQQGKLSKSTLVDYYGEKRFEQIAESNALEGSTLSVGETELAVLRGITISGHDPAYSRDAQALARALDELTHMAREDMPTDIEQVRHLHELVFGDRPGAGTFRTSEIRIRGAAHVPPRTIRQVMDQMEQWQTWSRTNAEAPPVLRAAVLHAWLEHIHPFIDGNGRVGRAITNLELVRAGYPPIIIRRKDRDQYLEALGRADGGDLGAFVDLVAGRLEDSLRDLERAAQRRQGYDIQRERYRQAQANRLELWKAGVHLLFASIHVNLVERLGESRVEMREYDPLGVEDFIDLCEGRPVRLSWAFTIRCKAPGVPTVERLAWAGVAGDLIKQRLLGEAGRPVLMWSAPNTNSYPPWLRLEVDSPGGTQMTILGDRWLVNRNGAIIEYSPSELADRVGEDISDLTVPKAVL